MSRSWNEILKSALDVAIPKEETPLPPANASSELVRAFELLVKARDQVGMKLRDEIDLFLKEGK